MAAAKHPCKICGQKLMAHPDSECANCYLAIQILGGRDMRPSDDSRWTAICESMRIIREMVDSGKWSLRPR